MGHAPDRQPPALHGLHSFPLSLRMCPGAPRALITSVISWRTRSPDIERSTSSSTHSRVNSSTTVRKRSGRPMKSLSSTKSQHHTWLGCSASMRSTPLSDTPSLRFLRFFRGTRSPSRRHSRCTRLWFTRQPSIRRRPHTIR